MVMDVDTPASVPVAARASVNISGNVAGAGSTQINNVSLTTSLYQHLSLLTVANQSMQLSLTTTSTVSVSVL